MLQGFCGFYNEKDVFIRSVSVGFQQPKRHRWGFHRRER
jgi:hypothetical protein